MRVDSTFRAMWLLNHTTARKFEIPMLNAVGISEIFTPKIYPNDPIFRSASVSYEEDRRLSIPQQDLLVLNQANWYGGATQSDWELASKYFDICFFILHDINVLRGADYFAGALILRAYGLNGSLTYSKLISTLSAQLGLKKIRSLGSRFNFAVAYDHLPSKEDLVLRSRSVYLPLGLPSVELRDVWKGGNRKIFFVCPEVAINPYYLGIYEKFVVDFKDYAYAIGGSQSIKIDDPHVLGFVSDTSTMKTCDQWILCFIILKSRFTCITIHLKRYARACL